MSWHRVGAMYVTSTVTFMLLMPWYFGVEPFKFSVVDRNIECKVQIRF